MDGALKARKASVISPGAKGVQRGRQSTGTRHIVLLPSDLTWGTVKILNSWLGGTLTRWARPTLPAVTP